MLNIIKNIPNVNTYPLNYVFEVMKLKHKPNTLWLEFGVGEANTINYISNFTNEKVYGFDSFEGNPEKWRDGFEKGAFTRNGVLPQVNNNIELIKGLFNETLVNFIQSQNKKVSFIHIDADLYSSTKFVLNALKNYIDEECIIIFDELVNYPGFDGETGELKAFYEFITENNVEYEWIGMNGTPTGMSGYYHENVAVIIHKINPTNKTELSSIKNNVSYNNNNSNTINKNEVVIVIARYNEEISRFSEFNSNIVVYNKGKDDISPLIDRTKIINVPNLGREAGTYCNYILDNYDNLPEYMIFTQAHPADHITHGNDLDYSFVIFRTILEEEKNYKFKYLCCKQEPFDKDSVAEYGACVYETPIELGNPKNINDLINDIRHWISVNCPHEMNNAGDLFNKLLNFGSPTIWPWDFTKIFRSTSFCGNNRMRHEITRDCFDYSKIDWLVNRPEKFSFGFGAIFIVHRDNILKYSRSYWQRLFDSLQYLLPGPGWGCERLWGFLLGEGDFYPKKH